MKTIALIEDNWGGHRPTYLKIFTKTLLEFGHQVIVFCPEPKELSEWIIQNSCLHPERLYSFKFQKPEPSSFPVLQIRLILNAVNCWRNVKKSIQYVSLKIGNSPDLVFFPWLDSYLAPYLTHHLIDTIFPYQWSGLYFHPRHLRLRQKFWSICRGPLREHAMLKSAHCPAIAVLDEGISEKLQSKIGGKSVITFPDFTDTSPPDFNFPIIQQIKEQAQGKKIIGLLGSQSKRKGLLTLLEVAQQMAQEEYFFVFAGRLAEQTFTVQELTNIQNFVNSGQSNCFFYFESIPDGTAFNTLVNICDILFAAYEKFPHSSNMLTKAAISEKPIIVSKKFCMAERIEKFKLGLSINEGDVDQCIEAIEDLCYQEEMNNRNLQPHFEDYRSLHSTAQLKSAFQKILDKL
ncbi:glycosyltransferase [Pleurocapsa sp. PCC 7319]|uniref:glycosyltransferase n=1 Tax=Pleurocapsa sp. PCC 7319 TaxID=118161 RepID=UPI0003652815|nr:glycosyltransferase [Pleurocapsa sp. PCC 7319]